MLWVVDSNATVLCKKNNNLLFIYWIFLLTKQFQYSFILYFVCSDFHYSHVAFIIRSSLLSLVAGDAFAIRSWVQMIPSTENRAAIYTQNLARNASTCDICACVKREEKAGKCEREKRRTKQRRTSKKTYRVSTNEWLNEWTKNPKPKNKLNVFVTFVTRPVNNGH